MAINAIQSNTQNGVGHLACDFASDKADLPEYAKSNNLKLGTDCIVVATGEVLMMQSDYTFKAI